MSDDSVNHGSVNLGSVNHGSVNHGRAPIAVANAPVSYGAFELTVGQDPNVPTGTHVLDQVAAAGYTGIDLGPVGYLGDGERLGELLAERGLGLAGAYVELPYSDPAEGERAQLEALRRQAESFAEFAGGAPGQGATAADAVAALTAAEHVTAAIPTMAAP